MSLVLVSHYLSLLERDFKSCEEKQEMGLVRRRDDNTRRAKKEKEESCDDNQSVVEESEEDVRGRGADGEDQCDQSGGWEAIQNQSIFSIQRKDRRILDGGGWREVKCNCKEERHYVWTFTSPSMEPGYEWELDVPQVTIESSSAQSVGANDTAIDYDEVNEFPGLEPFQEKVSRYKSKKTRRRGSKSEMEGGCDLSMSPCQEAKLLNMKRQLAIAEEKPPPPQDIKYPVLEKVTKKSLFRCPYCSLAFTKPNGLIRHFRVHKNAILRTLDLENGKDCSKKKDSKNVIKASSSVSTKADIEKTKFQKKWKLIPCSVVLTRFVPKRKVHSAEASPSKTSEKIKSIQSINKSSNKTKRSELLQGFGTTKKPYNCEFCLKKFSAPSRLKSHLFCHTKKKLHKCQLCPSSFARRAELKRHMITHTNERPHQCHLCSKSFARKDYLKLHIITHMDERPHQCHLCSKSFKLKSVLKRHIQHHAGKRPYQCQWCSKRFEHKVTLTVHIRIHTGERPHKCQLCSKSFMQSGHLKKHMLTHTNKKSLDG